MDNGYQCNEDLHFILHTGWVGTDTELHSGAPLQWHSLKLIHLHHSALGKAAELLGVGWKNTNNPITVKYSNGSNVQQGAGTPLQLTAAPLNNLLRIATISHHCHLLSTRHKLNIADVEWGVRRWWYWGLLSYAGIFYSCLFYRLMRIMFGLINASPSILRGFFNIY